eukprot:TRINITY_DN1677_c0_g1_i1.p1 TRINITY_DN1677_c0_g1~~TRINITY_DN1677_c0_g1_i1.p1  ORF type:complete len:504 (-),score=106.48 TRINITY_DN1677_c0_g1_i1:81-1448(-)
MKSESQSFTSVVSSLRSKDLTFFFLDFPSDFNSRNLHKELEDFFRSCAHAKKLQNSFIILLKPEGFSLTRVLHVSPTIEQYHSCERLLVLENITPETLSHLATRVYERNFQVPSFPCNPSQDLLYPPLPQKLALSVLLVLLLVGFFVAPPPSTNLSCATKQNQHINYKGPTPTVTESAPRPQPAPKPQATSNGPSAPIHAESNARQTPIQTEEGNPLINFLQKPLNEPEIELDSNNFHLSIGDARLFLRLLRVGVFLLEADIKNASDQSPNIHESGRVLHLVEEQLRQAERNARIMLDDLTEAKQRALEQQKRVQEAKARMELLGRKSDFMANEVELLHRIKKQRGAVSEAELKEKMESMWKNMEEKGEAERKSKEEEERLKECEEKEKQLTVHLQLAERVKTDTERERETRKREAYMLKLKSHELSREKEDKKKKLLFLRTKTKKWEEQIQAAT